MNKEKIGFNLQIIFSIVGILMTIFGAFLMIYSSVFSYSLAGMAIALCLITFGITAFNSAKMIITSNALIKSFNEYITVMFNATQKNKQANDITTVNITSDLDQEQLKKILKQYPEIAVEFEKLSDVIRNTFKGNLTIDDLEEELKKAVGENDFERAAELRDEIKKIKDKK